MIKGRIQKVWFSLSPETEGRITEWVDHLHEPFMYPAQVKHARYTYKRYYTSKGIHIYLDIRDLQISSMD